MHLPKNNYFFILLAFIFLIFFNGISLLPPLDRDESRFASASKNMLETSDYIDIEIEGVKRYKKPIGIYWAQVASNMIFGEPPYDKIWIYRLPSLLSIFICIISIFYVTRKLFNDDVAKLSCLFLIFSFLTISEIHQAKSDGLLLLCVTICNLILLNYLSEGRRNPNIREIFLFWVFLSLGIMTKGPIILVFVVFPILFYSIFQKSNELIKYFKSFFGYVILFVIVVPWFYMISLKSSGEFWHESLGHDLFSKIVSGQESHGFYPGYYSLLIFIFLWPASIFLPDIISLFIKMIKKKVKISNVNLFLGISFLGPFLIYEFIPTKLPHYVLPTYIPVTILISDYLIKNFNTKKFIFSKKKLPLVLLTPILISFIYLYAIVEYSNPDPYLYLIIMIVCLFIFFISTSYLTKSTGKFLISSLSFQLFVYLSLIFYINPKLNTFWIAKNINNLSESFSDGKIFHYGFNEPSLVFLFSHKSRRVSPQIMQGLFYNEPNSIFIVSGSYIEELKSLMVNEKDFVNIYNFSGFNYSKGQNIKVSAFTNESSR